MNIKKKLILLLSLLITVSVFTACQAPVDIDQTSEASQDFPVIVNEVTISSKPQKVAVLSGSIADIVVALGYEESLIIVSDDATQPEFSAAQKVSAGDTNAVISAEVDLVIGRNMTSEEISAYNGAGINVLDFPSPATRSDYEYTLSHIGSALGGANTGYNHGLNTAKNIYTSMDDISRIIPESDLIATAAMIIDKDEFIAVSGDTILDNCFSYAGVTNVFSGLEGNTFKLEDLSMFNPIHIFCVEGTKEELMNDPNYSSLYAVQEGNVHEIPLSYMTWEGRTIVAATTFVAGAVYPELLQEETATVELPEEISEPLESMEPSSSEESATEEESSATSTMPDDPEAAKNEDESSEESEVSESEETSTTEESPYTELKLGDDNDQVLALQERLSVLGYLTVEYGGLYGTVTEEAVKLFQAEADLEVTGIADIATQEALFAEGAPMLLVSG